MDHQMKQLIGNDVEMGMHIDDLFIIHKKVIKDHRDRGIILSSMEWLSRRV